MRQHLSFKTVAITGGIASGKSSIGRYLRQKGYTVIDADSLSRELVLPNSATLMLIQAEFGDEILLADGSLNRKALADIVFSDDKKLQKLNAIMHPKLRILLQNRLRQAQDGGANVVFAEIPLLYQLGWQRDFDAVWLVLSSRRQRINRAMQRDNLSQDEVLSRVDKQGELAEYANAAHCVFYNDGTLEDLYALVDDALKVP